MTATAGSAIVRLGVGELERRLGVERSTLWRWYRAGRFPAPHYLCERRVWYLHEIEAWEREQLARPPEARRGNGNIHSAAGPQGPQR